MDGLDVGCVPQCCTGPSLAIASNPTLPHPAMAASMIPVRDNTL
jgi:hypothetical protein